jgi:hypothetical protein
MKWGPQTWDSIATILQNNKKSWKKTIDNGWRGEEDLPPNYFAWKRDWLLKFT